MAMKYLRMILTTIGALGIVALSGCGGGGGGASGSAPTTPATGGSGTTSATPAAIILSSSPSSIKADGSNSTTITAQVVDANNMALKGATVNFTSSSSSGQFGVSSGVSGDNGTVTISYKATGTSGTPVLTNRTDVITATVVGTSVSNTLSMNVTASAMSLLIGTSAATVKSDGSDSATITATVLDANNLPVSGQTVRFTAATGQLGTASGTSSTAGLVTIPFSALTPTGTPDKTNRTETITANIVGTSVTAQIPVSVVGSTLTLTPSQSNAGVGSAVSLTASAKDAAAVGVAGQTVRFAIASSSTGAGTLSATSATTGTNGSTPSITLTATAAGNVVINADWLNSAGASTLTASTTISVTSEGVSFSVTDPTTNPTSLTLGASRPISVSVPTTISGSAVANVRFATTLGTWSNGAKVSTVARVGSSVGEALSAGINSGTANVQIDALDGSGNVLATLNRIFALTSATATKVSLQPSVSTIAPSTGGTTNSATLTATVRDNSNNTVGNVPVLFEIVNPTGSGEQISPVVAYSNSNGQAISTFTSGSVATSGALQIKATVVGSSPAVEDTKSINVAGTAVSVTLGAANMLSSTDNNTTYTLAMSVLVVSNTGAAIPNATVTLSAFPRYYYRGTRDATCDAVYTSGMIPGGILTASFPNEDVNENDILDPGEDYDPIGDGRGVGAITPPHSAAGTLPATVVTNENGVGNFNLIYQKDYADWVMSRIRAKVVVNGTESVNELNYVLRPLAMDTEPICTLTQTSPFGP